MKSSRPASAQWRSSKTMTTCPARRSARRRCARRRTAPRCPRPGPPQPRAGPARRGSIQRRSASSGTHCATASPHLGPGRGVVVGLEQAAAAADHLAERPEGDALAVGGDAAVVPVDRLDEAVDVLQELPGQAALADARRPDDRHEAGPPLAGRRVEEVLEQAQLLVAADEWRLEAFAPIAPADLGHDAERPPRRDRGWPCP